MTEHTRVAIVGAGPTGISAAWRLNELGCDDWLLIDRASTPGGLSSSVVDEKGFVWDLGGHVLFSHYSYFDRLMEQALGDAWVEHVRESWVWIRERWVPYPFQNNIWRLPEDDLSACLAGLVGLAEKSGLPQPRPETFRDWLLGSFGPGLCDVFMFPYNRKVWAYDPSQMNVEWMGERVAVVELRRVLDNLVRKRNDVSWGPNATFKFPLRGGTGAIWTSLHRQLPPSRSVLGDAVVSVDAPRRELTLASGRRIAYERLISTMPRDELLERLRGAPELQTDADEYVWSGSHIVGIGLRGQPPEALRTKCWIYFPEESTPFYRATVFSNYSPFNVPKPGAQWSLMAEISESPQKPVDPDRVISETLEGFRRCGFLTTDDVVESTWHRFLPKGYPTPWLGRDAIVDSVERPLQELGIWSRGRFGLWKYEVANQDHSSMQGVWAAEAALGLAERTPGAPEIY